MLFKIFLDNRALSTAISTLVTLFTIYTAVFNDAAQNVLDTDCFSSIVLFMLKGVKFHAISNAIYCIVLAHVRRETILCVSKYA